MKILNPVTEAIIFRTMNAGIGRITEANYVDFYLRCKMTSECFGPPMHKGGERFDITLEDVRAHIGLSTNVSTKTVSTFWKQVKEEIERRERRLSSQRERVAANG